MTIKTHEEMQTIAAEAKALANAKFAVDMMARIAYKAIYSAVNLAEALENLKQEGVAPLESEKRIKRTTQRAALMVRRLSRVYRIAAQYTTRTDYDSSILADFWRDADKWERFAETATDKIWGMSRDNNAPVFNF